MSDQTNSAGGPAESAPAPEASDKSRFEDQASEKPPSLLAEFAYFLRHNAKWWLTPIFILIALIALIVVLAGTVGPFIYPGL